MVVIYSLLPPDMLPTIAKDLRGAGTETVHVLGRRAAPPETPAGNRFERFLSLEPKAILGSVAQGATLKHFMAYVLLTFVGVIGHRSRAVGPLLAGGLLVIAVTTELLQLLVPSRTPHFLTIAVNAAGVGVGLALARAVLPRQRIK